MIPSTHQPNQQQQQEQEQASTGVSEDYPSDWTSDYQATDVDETTAQDNDDQFITGQSLVDDTNNIER